MEQAWLDLIAIESDAEAVRAERLMKNARQVEIYRDKGKTLIVAHYGGCVLSKGLYSSLSMQEAEKLAPKDKHGCSKAVCYFKEADDGR